MCVCVLGWFGGSAGNGVCHCPVIRYCGELKANEMVKALDFGARGFRIQSSGPGNLGQVASPLSTLVSVLIVLFW